ncbi:MAG: methyltransferase domain-containing protein [Anaerolineales bacterium]|nr:methyltransferase domain-containing protein [Anaerolineales bacterium]
MVEPVQACPLCGNPDSQPFDRRQFRGQWITNRICVYCGLVYQTPRMDREELGAFYADQYRQVYQGEAGPTEKDLLIQRRRAVSLLEFTRTAVLQIGSMLDIGCSAGTLLQVFRQEFDCRVTGIEPGDSYRAFAQNQGIEVFSDLESLAAERQTRFDLISKAHVLEHLPDPVAYLAEIRQDWLKPDGWLLIEVPNLYCHDSFEVAHLVAFSPHTLRQTLEQAGYRVSALEAHGRPRSAVLPLYLTVLARPIAEDDTKPVVVPEKRVTLKRQWGLLRRRILQRLAPEKAWLSLETDRLES